MTAPGRAKWFLRPKNLKKTYFTVASSAACLVIVYVLMAAQPTMFKRLDRIVYDIYLRGFTGGEPSPVPILIDIDEKSIAEMGQWPWPRYRLAELLATLYEYGVASVGVDILMGEQDRTSPALWARQISDDFGIEPDTAWLPGELMDNDKYLASVVSQIPAVLSANGTSDPGDVPETAIRSFKISPIWDPGVSSEPLSTFLPGWEGIQVPVPDLSEVALVGLMNAEGDEDGIFRRVPLFNAYKGVEIAGLALATLALGAGDNNIAVRIGRDGVRSIRVAGIEVPVSKEATLPIAFRGGRDSYPTYSAVDVMERSIPQEDISGRIAFVGSTSAGLLDLRPTPFEKTFPGLEIHAALVDTILSQRFIIEPESRVGLELMLMLLTGVVAAVLFSAVRPHIALPLGIGLGAAVWLGLRYAMISRGIYLTPLYSLINMALQAFSSSALRFWLEESEKRVLRKAFSNYVSPEIVGQIIERGSVESLQGEHRNISVLFTDIRDFTSLTEKMAPTQVVGMLGSYFSPMTAIVRDSMGTLDKFVGDALMAFWNAPLDVPDHPSKAVSSLMEMHRALDVLNETLEAEYGVRLRMGGGIHTGFAHVGNMGTHDLMDYTAIGDTVNTASRLEGMCTKYGVSSLISKDTADFCTGAFRLVSLDLVKVKGKSEGIPIFTVVAPEDAEARNRELELWEEAFALYARGDFRASGKICQSLLDERPQEKLYRIFAERTGALAENVPENWDGVFAYESK
ncbi:MAG: adenylate/guanylate cyclase domain-containing protein [Synergistaceae bacterium]|jgi:adenylate cyclase|nr:adenylate/guanylate cyclase domain-containing protein [Synergistaceae bacterium]